MRAPAAGISEEEKEEQQQHEQAQENKGEKETNANILCSYPLHK